MERQYSERKVITMSKERKSNLHTDEVFGCRKINPKWCQTCRFSKGKPPFEDAPEKAYCIIYSRDEGEEKPPEVYYDGEKCEYYHKDPEKH